MCGLQVHGAVSVYLDMGGGGGAQEPYVRTAHDHEREVPYGRGPNSRGRLKALFNNVSSLNPTCYQCLSQGVKMNP